MLKFLSMLDLGAVVQILSPIQVYILQEGNRNPENHTARCNQNPVSWLPEA